VGRLSLPSGGETALTAVAMLVAIFRARRRRSTSWTSWRRHWTTRTCVGCSACSNGYVAELKSSMVAPKSPSLAGEFGGDHFARVGPIAGGRTHRWCPAGFGHPGGEFVGPGGVLRGWDPTQVRDRRFAGSGRKAPGGAHVQSLDLSWVRPTTTKPQISAPQQRPTRKMSGVRSQPPCCY
jgi:MYXO-CTERM domain-containing protein